MASFDDFLDLAGRGPVPARPVRASLQRVRPRQPGAADRERRHRAVILAGVALAHLLLGLMLREAMRPSPQAEGRDDHLIVTFIVRVPPAPRVEPAAAPPAPSRIARAPHSTQATGPPHAPLATHRDARGALQAVDVSAPPGSFAPPGPSGAIATTPAPPVSLYGPDGRLRVPPAASPATPRNLLERRSAAWMLPGAPRPDSPDFYVTRGKSPQDYVNGTARILSGLIAGVPSRPDGNGMVPAIADRGLRMSGRDSGPCEDLAIDLADVDPDHVKVREQAQERWEKTCEDR